MEERRNRKRITAAAASARTLAQRSGSHGILADILARKGDNEAAIRHAKVALASNPELPHVRTVLAKAYLAVKRADLAVPELEKAAPYDLTGNSHFLLYRAFKQLGREEDAKAALVKFKQLHGLPVYQ